jgi:hypothetical protein
MHAQIRQKDDAAHHPGTELQAKHPQIGHPTVMYHIPEHQANPLLLAYGHQAQAGSPFKLTLRTNCSAKMLVCR